MLKTSNMLFTYWPGNSFKKCAASERGRGKDLGKKKRKKGVISIIKLPYVCIITFILNEALMCFQNKHLIKSKIYYCTQFINTM